jgi:hypothetical protein
MMIRKLRSLGKVFALNESDIERGKVNGNVLKALKESLKVEIVFQRNQFSTVFQRQKSISNSKSIFTREFKLSKNR